MKKILFTFFCISVFFSCNNDINEYEKNLDHFKHLIKDINTYFIDSKQDTLKISDYYDEDFIFYSFPAGHKKGVETNKSDYIENLNQMKKVNMSINIGHSIYCRELMKNHISSMEVFEFIMVLLYLLLQVMLNSLVIKQWILEMVKS